MKYYAIPLSRKADITFNWVRASLFIAAIARQRYDCNIYYIFTIFGDLDSYLLKEVNL